MNTKKLFRSLICLVLTVVTLLNTFTFSVLADTNTQERLLQLLNTAKNARILPYMTFYRDQLSDDEQACYDIIYSGLMDHKTEFKAGLSCLDELPKLLKAVLFDHPEIFWCDDLHGYKLYDEPGMMEIRVDYFYNEKTTRLIQGVIDTQVDAFIYSDKVKNASDYMKILETYRYVIRMTDYDKNEDNISDNQNIDSIFVKHETVCAGYAKGVKYILNKLGIGSLVVRGTATDSNGEAGSHAWNIVCYNGRYYQLDATWDDFTLDFDSYCSPASKELLENEWMSYNYFLCSDEMMSGDHRLSDTYVYPPCEDTDAYYYVVTNKYVSYYDEALLHEVIDKDLRSGRSVTVLKAADSSILDTLDATGTSLMYYGLDSSAGTARGVAKCRILTCPSTNQVVFLWMNA